MGMVQTQMTQADAAGKYGPIVNGIWTDELKWCATCVIPADIAQNWVKTATGNPTLHVYCNKDMAIPLMIALDNVKTRGLLNELKTFDGCYEVRDIRGIPGKMSAHSYAMAIDVNASQNPLGKQGLMTLPFIQCWKDAGFVWGGDFSRRDAMHFSMLGW